MSYENKSDLPASVKDHLPAHAQDIYMKSFNSAWKQYKDPEKRRGDTSREETAHAVAWSAVKNEYEKSGDQWVKKKAGKERQR